MITTSQMYWLVTLDSIANASLVFAILSALASVGAIGMACDSNRLFWLPFITIGLFFLFVGVLTFVPTTKQAAAIIIVPKIANNEKVQDCGNRIYDLAIEWMEELKPTKKDK